MLNRYVTLAVMMNLCLAAGEAEAAEITLKPDNNAGMAVSIYNQNLALIKDSPPCRPEERRSKGRF